MKKLLRYVPEYVKEPFRVILDQPHPYGLPASEYRRLSRLPRFEDATAKLFGKNFRICDAASFLLSHKEIFENKIYHFEHSIENPIIIDAGANTGLSTLYFGLNVPRAQIISIECDRHIVDILRQNVHTYELKGVDVRFGAAWNSNEDLHFSSDHADAGRLVEKGEDIVPGIRIRDFLEDNEIDLLKIDIEGAETTVLQDCGDVLHRVKRLFVEYHSFVDQPQSLAEILLLLQEKGFRYYIDRTGVHSSNPLIERYTELGYDLQLNIFSINEAIQPG